MLWALVDLCGCPTSQLLLLLEAGLQPAEMGALVQFGSSRQGEQWLEVGGRGRPSDEFIFPFLPAPRSLHPRAGLLRGCHGSPQPPLPSGSTTLPAPGPFRPTGRNSSASAPVPGGLPSSCDRRMSRPPLVKPASALLVSLCHLLLASL